MPWDSDGRAKVADVTKTDKLKLGASNYYVGPQWARGENIQPQGSLGKGYKVYGGPLTCGQI